MCNAMLLYYLKRCWNIIYYIVFLEGYAGDSGASKANRYQTWVLTGREVLPMPTNVCSLVLSVPSKKRSKPNGLWAGFSLCICLVDFHTLIYNIFFNIFKRTSALEFTTVLVTPLVLHSHRPIYLIYSAFWACIAPWVCGLWFKQSKFFTGIKIHKHTHTCIYTQREEIRRGILRR